jgi:adenylate kinase
LFVFGEGKRRGEKRKKQEEIEMFATAVRLLANKARVLDSGPVKVSDSGEQVQSALETLVNILKEHEPSL